MREADTIVLDISDLIVRLGLRVAREMELIDGAMRDLWRILCGARTNLRPDVAHKLKIPQCIHSRSYPRLQQEHVLDYINLVWTGRIASFVDEFSNNSWLGLLLTLSWI